MMGAIVDFLYYYPIMEPNDVVPEGFETSILESFTTGNIQEFLVNAATLGVVIMPTTVVADIATNTEIMEEEIDGPEPSFIDPLVVITKSKIEFDELLTLTTMLIKPDGTSDYSSDSFDLVESTDQFPNSLSVSAFKDLSVEFGIDVSKIQLQVNL